MPSDFYFYHSKIIQRISPQPLSSISDNYFQELINNHPSNLNTILWEWNSLKECVNSWAKHSKLITAAGGIVKNKSQDILFIYRNNHWDLPKGKVENNEVISAAAVREVKEETGIDASISKQEASLTHHLFPSQKENIFYLKKTYWYEMMMSDSQQSLIPQGDEGIEKAVWVNKYKWDQMRQKAFPLIKDLISQLNW